MVPLSPFLNALCCSFPSFPFLVHPSPEQGGGRAEVSDGVQAFQEAFFNPLLLLPTEKKDTVLRQVRLDPCDLQPIFDDMLHILNPEELHVIEEIPQAEDKLDRLFEIAGVKSQEASQTLLDSVYSHLPDLL